MWFGSIRINALVKKISAGSGLARYSNVSLSVDLLISTYGHEAIMRNSRSTRLSVPERLDDYCACGASLFIIYFFWMNKSEMGFCRIMNVSDAYLKSELKV